MTIRGINSTERATMALVSGESAPLAARPAEPSTSTRSTGKRYPRRVTLDLSQVDYDELNLWLDGLGLRKVTQADALRAMINVTMDNGNVQQMVIAQLKGE